RSRRSLIDRECADVAAARHRLVGSLGGRDCDAGGPAENAALINELHINSGTRRVEGNLASGGSENAPGGGFARRENARYTGNWRGTAGTARRVGLANRKLKRHGRGRDRRHRNRCGRTDIAGSNGEGRAPATRNTQDAVMRDRIADCYYVWHRIGRK